MAAWPPGLVGAPGVAWVGSRLTTYLRPRRQDDTNTITTPRSAVRSRPGAALSFLRHKRPGCPRDSWKASQAVASSECLTRQAERCRRSTCERRLRCTGECRGRRPLGTDRGSRAAFALIFRSPRYDLIELAAAIRQRCGELPLFVYNRRGNQAVRLHQRRFGRHLVSGRRFRDSWDHPGSSSLQPSLPC